MRIETDPLVSMAANDGCVTSSSQTVYIWILVEMFGDVCLEMFLIILSPSAQALLWLHIREALLMTLFQCLEHERKTALGFY